MLSFSSYRDPNLDSTLDIYAKSAEALNAAELTDEALEQAIVGAIGDLDAPMTAEQKGYRALNHYLTGVTTEVRQKFRDDVLATSRASFAALTERMRGKKLKACVFGSGDAIASANAAREEDEQITVVCRL